MERKLYKTKLCILYQRGHCARQSCSFAHGDAELRRFGGSTNGRRDYRGGDLRDKLVRRYSPRRRYSPDRDGRSRHMFQGHKSAHLERGHSASRSPVSRRERKRSRLDGQDDVSPSLKTSDLADEQIKEGRVSSYGEIDAIEEQLKQTELDLEMFDDHKCQLEAFLEEKAQEANKLSAKIEELETQLEKEQDDCRRFTSKIKKFIKAQTRISRAQEELKRSQARLQRVCNQFDIDSFKQGNNEEDSSILAVSDGEPSGNGRLSPIKKKSRFESGDAEETKTGSLRKRERSFNSARAENRYKEDGGNVSLSRTIVRKHQGDDYRSKDSNGSPATAPLAKGRGVESGRGLPSTSMAAQAVDEFLEAMDLEEKFKESPLENGGGVDHHKSGPPILPPKGNPTSLSQYEGDDELVDVEEVDVDIGGEAEIQKV